MPAPFTRSGVNGVCRSRTPVRSISALENPGLPWIFSFTGAGTIFTLLQSASSSSAMISGSDVIDPCPISVAADMMVMVPSVAMLTHGFIAVPVRSANRTAAPARPVAVKANVSPAAPIIT